MSEFINNYSAKRQELLKDIIRSLHEGESFENARAKFKEHFEDVTTQEISQMEQALIKEGMTINEVQRLCDVHAAVFDGAISDIHQIKGPKETPGHPIQVFLAENEQ